jgi:putative transposase
LEIDRESAGVGDEWIGRASWPTYIRIHLALLAATDFFTAEVLTLRGLVTYYVLFFIHLESRRVVIAGITVHPYERWMEADRVK